MVYERIKSLREKLEKRKQNTKAKARAKARKVEKKQAERERKKAERKKRIKEGNPEGARERGAAAVREAKKAKKAVADRKEAKKGLRKEQLRFVASELGVSPDRAEKVLKTGSEVLQSAKDSGMKERQLDFDGDGDSDILRSLDEPMAMERDQDLAVDPTEPVVDMPGRLEEPLFSDEGFDEATLGQSSPGEISLDGSDTDPDMGLGSESSNKGPDMGL